MPLYIAYNGVEPTTAKRVAVASGTAIKTMQQIATPSTTQIKVIAFGISGDASAAATPGAVELIVTDVAATGGSSVTPTKFDDPNGPVSLCVGGTGATNHTPSAEGTITAVRSLRSELVAPTNQFSYEWSLGREAKVEVSKFLRVRVHFAVTVNLITWILYEE